uniref:Polyketide synthase n=1 Tax=Peronospora matthiolae TaxID=2874970 RepID=A0AAV1U3Y0_9STRA
MLITRPVAAEVVAVVLAAASQVLRRRLTRLAGLLQIDVGFAKHSAVGSADSVHYSAQWTAKFGSTGRTPGNGSTESDYSAAVECACNGAP